MARRTLRMDEALGPIKTIKKGNVVFRQSPRGYVGAVADADGMVLTLVKQNNGSWTLYMGGQGQNIDNVDLGKIPSSVEDSEFIIDLCSMIDDATYKLIRGFLSENPISVAFDSSLAMSITHKLARAISGVKEQVAKTYRNAR